MSVAVPSRRDRAAGPAGPGLRGRARGWVVARPWLLHVGFPLAVFALTRLYAALAVLVQVAARGPVPPDAIGGGGAADYQGVITNWDGQWYERIATGGYPSPTDAPDDPTTAQTWAFPPLFPLAVGVLLRTGMGFGWAVTVVDLVAGAAGVVVLFAVLHQCGGRRTAISGVALVCCFVTAPLLQAAYSEALALLLLVMVFWALVERHYVVAFPAVLFLSYTRIITPPLAVVVVAHLVHRWRRRAEQPVARSQVVLLLLLALTCLAGALSWAVTARLTGGGETAATGRPVSAGLGLGWFSSTYGALGLGGPVLVGLLLGLLALLSTTPGARRWGVEARTWLWCYPAFLVLVTPVTSGILRYLLLCFPLGLAGVEALSGRSRRAWAPAAATAALCVGGLVAQWWWVGVGLVQVRGLMP